MMLGDLGATVTKIDRPERADDTRAGGPPYDSVGEATYAIGIHRLARHQRFGTNSARVEHREGLHMELERAGTRVELTRNPIGLTATPPEYRLPPPQLLERETGRAGR